MVVDMAGKQISTQGFTVIPVKYTEDSTATQYLYVKQHEVRNPHPSLPSNRTLFVLNVPSYVNKNCLQRLFSDSGKVEAVHLHKNPVDTPPETERPPSEFFSPHKDPSGHTVAYVVFKNTVSAKKAVKETKTRILSTPEHPISTGIAKWCKDYRQRCPQLEVLQKEIDDYMAVFDSKVEKEKETAREAEGVPDEEGWVTVTRYGKSKGVPRTEAHEKRLSKKEKKKRTEKELLNFYSFQMRETKREHIAQLRQKFEEDKQRVAEMKAARKFRPY
ncbi:Ribosomal RNA-processing-like protein 7A [Lamellibrachia satsuma]|nr:Ribosomal RNA-processing-like protein 7A [Lamellibrachia satsuma]